MPKILIDDILNNIFTDKDEILIDSIIKLDIDTLRKFGTVTLSSYEEDGMMIEELYFKSDDGEHDFKRVESFAKSNVLYNMVKKINDQIAMAVSEENYEKAAELKHKKDNLLLNNENNID